MSNPVSDLVLGFQDLVARVPDLVQPLIVALAGAVLVYRIKGVK